MIYSKEQNNILTSVEQEHGTVARWNLSFILGLETPTMRKYLRQLPFFLFHLYSYDKNQKRFFVNAAHLLLETHATEERYWPLTKQVTPHVKRGVGAGRK